MAPLLAAGILAAAWSLGVRCAARMLTPRMASDPFARHVVGLLLGVALVTPLLTLAAILDVLHLPIAGGVGWIVAALLVLRRGSPLAPAQRSLRPAALVLAGAVVFAIVASTGRDETLAAGRDQQIYLLFAQSLAQKGSAKLVFTGLDAADAALLDKRRLFHFPGTLPEHNGIDEPIQSYLPLGYSAWLAVAFALGATQAAYAANAAVVAVAGLALFVLTRALFGAAIALGATLAFYLLPSSLYIAGITLSEPLAGALLLLVPIFALAGARRAAAPIAVALLAATLVRIDALIAFPLVAAACALGTRASAQRSRRIALAWLAGALAAAIAVYAWGFPLYLAENSRAVAMLVAATAAVALFGAFAPPPLLGRLRSLAAAPAVRLGAGLLVALLFAYAATLRPLLEPFSLIANGSALDGTRDWREASIANLASYLSWPVLLAAVAGLSGALLNGWLARRGYARTLIALLVAGAALLYLWYPHVSPDHPWAVRRFVPLVIPGALVFAALCARTLAGPGRVAGALLGATMLAAPVAWTLQHMPDDIVLARESEGLSKGLQELAGALPDALVVVASDHPAIGTALFVTAGAKVIPLYEGLRGEHAAQAVESWARAKLAQGRPVWLLHDDFLPRTGARIVPVRQWEFERVYVEPTPLAPARRLATERIKLVLSRLDALDPDFAASMFGGEPIWGASEEGFFHTEIAPFGMFRYTEGDARITLPAKGLAGAVALKVDLFSFAPPGRRRSLDIVLDDVLAWTGQVDPGVTTLIVPIAAPTQEASRLALRSEVVAPAESGSEDPRELGIGLIGMRALKADDLRPPPPGVAGFRSTLALVGPAVPVVVAHGGVQDVVLEVTNAGRWRWPTPAELGTPVGAVRIGFRWHERGETERWVGDSRADFTIGLLPGDRTRMLLSLRPTALDGTPLPPGDYELRIGLLREGEALFADNGDAMLVLPVSVVGAP